MILHWIGAAIQLICYLGMAGSIVYAARRLIFQSIAYVRMQQIGSEQRRQLRHAVYQRSASRTSSMVLRTFNFSEYLDGLLAVALPKKFSVRQFMNFSYGCAVVVYLFIYLASGRLLAACLPALVSSTIPYLVLLFLQRRAVIANSYAVVPVISTLLERYRIDNRSMYHALQGTLTELKNSPLRRSLHRLFIRLQRHNSYVEALAVIRDFNRQTGTTWSTQLSVLILEGYVNGLDVEASLTELVADIEDAESVLKDQAVSRTDNLLLGFLPWFALPLGYVFLYRYGSPAILGLQFQTPRGVLLFTACIIASVLSSVVGLLMYKPKQDL